MVNKNDPSYALGRSESETNRLINQAKLYGGNTERLLMEVGLSAGMTVLDVGCGAGDVSFLASRMVGPTGRVVGIDNNPLVLETARSRAVNAGLKNVDFVEGDMRTATLADDFDLAVGRLVLLYTADPVESLTAVARHVRSGGAIAFQEFEFSSLSDHANAYPSLNLWGQIVQLITEAFRQTGAHLSMGSGLYDAYRRAGLGEPHVWAYSPVGGPRNWSGFDHMADNCRSLLPLFERLNLISPEALDVDTMSNRLHLEVEATGIPLRLGAHYSAWVRKA